MKIHVGKLTQEECAELLPEIMDALPEEEMLRILAKNLTMDQVDELLECMPKGRRLLMSSLKIKYTCGVCGFFCSEWDIDRRETDREAWQQHSQFVRHGPPHEPSFIVDVPDGQAPYVGPYKARKDN